jgi:hypothetical protein
VTDDAVIVHYKYTDGLVAHLAVLIHPL